MNVVTSSTAHAAEFYTERSGVEVARVESSAAPGNLASFTKNNTLVFSTTTYIPVHRPSMTHFVPIFEDEGDVYPR